jgi:hypothetical protein
MRRNLLVLMALALGVTVAHADDRKHVALLEFEGPRATNIRGDVMRMAATKSWVSSSSSLDGRSVREFAIEHDVDLVVEGAVQKRGRRYQIRIRFLRGSTGRAITTATASLHKPALDRLSRRRIEYELVKALAALPPRRDDDDTSAFVQP